MLAIKALSATYPNQEVLAVSNTGSTSNTLSVYQFTASGIGTKYTNPSYNNGAGSSAVAFNSLGNTIALGANGSFSTIISTTAIIQAWQWSKTGFV